MQAEQRDTHVAGVQAPHPHLAIEPSRDQCILRLPSCSVFQQKFTDTSSGFCVATARMLLQVASCIASAIRLGHLRGSVAPADR